MIFEIHLPKDEIIIIIYQKMYGVYEDKENNKYLVYSNVINTKTEEHLVCYESVDGICYVGSPDLLINKIDNNEWLINIGKYGRIFREIKIKRGKYTHYKGNN